MADLRMLTFRAPMTPRLAGRGDRGRPHSAAAAAARAPLSMRKRRRCRVRRMRLMKHARPSSARRLVRRGAARVIKETPAAERDDAGLLNLPDGWYWMAPDGHQQFGPFDSAELARADRARGSVEAIEDDGAIREVERVAGIAESSADVETERAGEDRESSEP